MVNGIMFLLVGVALGCLSLVIGQFIYQRARQWWQNKRYGAPIDHSLLLAKYSRRLTSLPEMQAIADVLRQEIPLELQTLRAELLLLDVHDLAATGESALKVPVSHAAVRWVASAGEAQTAERGHLHGLVLQSRADLAWTQVWVPLMRGSALRGMWLLGAREQERAYSPADLRWLTALARDATALLESIQQAKKEKLTAEEMRALYYQMVKIREVERGRLSRELHDGALQDLCAVTRDLKALETRSDELRDLANRSGDVVNAIRAVCNDLRPPLLQQDLTSALRALVKELDARAPMPVSIDISVEQLELSEDMALAIFRIAQEALNNAIQHADASEIAVRLTQYPDMLRLTVTDDGRGIATAGKPAHFVAQGHFGLAGMRERAAMIGAKLDVQTAVDYGTVVILETPCVEI